MTLQALHTYSLIKALYDQGKDYLDAFWPILLQCMPRDQRPVAPSVAADEVTRAVGVTVPVHTVQTLAERAKRAHGYLARKSGCYSLTERGLAYLAALETPRQVDRRLTALVDFAVEDLGGLDGRFSDRTFTQAAIASVIERNIRVLDFVVDRSMASGEAAVSADEAILSFFGRLEAAQPAHFETLRDLILGSTLAALLKRDQIADVTRHFRQTELFLDTNLLLSLLDLRYEVECRPAHELLALVTRSTRFTLHAFDFTISELTSLLRGFSGRRIYPADVKVNALYASLQARGFGPSEVTALIADLPKRLRGLGISVVTTGVDVDRVPEELEGMLAVLQTYKPEQDRKGQRHDVAAIAHIALARRDTPRRVEDAGCFFLTEDYRLSTYAFVERKHRDNHTVSEVMPDRLLTNLLWLKDPSTFSALPISAVIAMHSRGLFIDRRVWERFYEEVGRLQNSGEVAEENASLLLYDAQVHRDLLGLGPEVKQVDRAWLLSRLEGVRARQKEATELELAQQQDRLTTEHQRASATAEEEHQVTVAQLARRAEQSELERKRVVERHLLSVERQRATEKRRATKTSTAIVRTAKVICGVAGAVIFASVGKVVAANWQNLEGPLTVTGLIVTTLAFWLGLRLDPGQMWERLHGHIGDWLLRRRLRLLADVLTPLDDA